jgi:hypothetical protein
MRRLGRVTTVSIAAAMIACGSNAGHQSGGGGAAAAGGAPFTLVVRTTVTGCLQPDDRGGYILRPDDDMRARRAKGTAGTIEERSPGSRFRTTGQGGDAIANAPTIGSERPAGEAYVVAPANDSVDISPHIGKRVEVDGVIIGGNVMRAASITRLADDCAPASHGR